MVDGCIWCSTDVALTMNYVCQSHIRAQNPNSNLPLSPSSHIPPNMERNPAYGQLSLSVDSNSSDYPGQSDELVEDYENIGGTTGSYAYITQ